MIGMRLTNFGRNLLAKGLLSKEIKFSKGQLGSGDFDYETESVLDVTELRHFEIDIPIESIEKVGDGTCAITCHTTNSEIYNAFECREFAVLAFDPDDGVEGIFSYCNVGNEYSYIQNNKSPVTKDIKFCFVVQIGDCENVTAVLDLSFAYTSSADFSEHVNSTNPHPNFIQKLDGVISTDKIWATDNDDNLHQISINNLKQILREEPVETEGDKLYNAKQELGLDANLLVVEDFVGESVTDNFKIKVTSSAENGNLIGVQTVDGIKTGAQYTISDGYNQEPVIIKAVINNVSGYHCKLENRLDNGYNFQNTFLYRSTSGGADKKTLTYNGAEFSGIEANIERQIELDADFEIEGDGIIDGDYLTLTL